MNARHITALALSLGLCSFAQADLIGVKGGVDYWFFDGQSNMNTALQNDQDFDQDGAAQVSISVEHPVPFIPNVKIKHVNLNAETDTQVATVPHTQVDLNNSDFILYYEILDNIVSLDAGIGAKVLNGDFKQYGLSTTKIDEVYPITYVAAGAKLPFTGLSAKGEASYSNFDDAKITDVQAELQYDFIDNMLVDVGAKVGYRLLNIDLDDYENRDMKFEFKGPYVGLEAHF